MTRSSTAFSHGIGEILARDGVTLVERKTGGAVENARLVADPRSGVDVAFMHGGVIREAARRRHARVALLRASVGFLPRKR